MVVSPEPSIPTSTVAAALWESVQAKWEDENVHEAFLQACAEENQLGYAARCYREQKDSGDEAQIKRCEQQLERITNLAVSQMASLRSAPKEPKRAITVVAVVVSMGLILACAYLMTL